MNKLSDTYLTFDNSEGLIDKHLEEMIVDCFNKNYQAICDFFNYGELRKTSIVPMPDYDGVAATYTETAKVIMSTKYYEANPLDADSLTHEWIHVAQNYKDFRPGWLTEGLADWGREKFGIYNKEADWALPKYNPKHHYRMAYRVTAAFLCWLEDNVDPKLPWKLNDALKQGKYKPSIWIDITGKTVDMLWEDYAKANS